MRLMIDSLIAMMVGGILVGLLMYYRQQDQLVQRQQSVQHSLLRLQEQMSYHRALGDVTITANGYPRLISPMWFGDELPTNLLVPPRQPWLDVAPEGDMSEHPPDPVILFPNQASFWYNPNKGIFRARVIGGFTDQEALRLYNLLNGCFLKALHRVDDPARQTRPLPVVLANDQKLRTVGDGQPASDAAPAIRASLREDTASQTTPSPAPTPTPGDGVKTAPNATEAPGPSGAAGNDDAQSPADSAKKRPSLAKPQ